MFAISSIWFGGIEINWGQKVWENMMDENDAWYLLNITDKNV